MSDLSQDSCTICGYQVAGVMSGPHCRIAYVRGYPNHGVCFTCLDELVGFRERIKTAPNPEVKLGPGIVNWMRPGDSITLRHPDDEPL